MTPRPQPTLAALLALGILHVVMLGALFAKVPPHPPETTPIFGIAPFIGLTLAVLGAAWLMGADTTRVGRGLCLVAALASAVSFGPQKYVDAQFPMIWPAVICAQVAIVVLGVQVLRSFAGTVAPRGYPAS